MWAGNGALPPAEIFASHMQHTAPKLRLRYITETNKILKELRDLIPTIKYNKSSEGLQNMEFLLFSDSSFNISAGRNYGHIGVVTGIQTVDKYGQNIFLLMDWASKKQKRVSHSSYRAEILACVETDTDDRLSTSNKHSMQ